MNDIAAAEGVSNTVTHLVYTHHHSDHAGASSLFGSNVVRIEYGENFWAAVKGYLDAVAETAAAPVTEKYTGVLGAVDVFTVPTAFSILESIRLDLGHRMDVHP